MDNWLIAGKWLVEGFKALRGYRTLIVNILAAAIPVIEGSNLTDFIPDRYMFWYALAVIVANVIIRVDTRTPVGERY